MSVSPKESCLFGGERIKISFPVQAALNPDAEYYVVFEGVLQRHVTKATLANEKTVRAVIPEHSTAETINLVVLCQNQKQDRQVLVTDTFTYHEDSSHLLARHLVESVDNAHALDNITQIRGNGFDLSSEDLTTLDSRLMKVFLEMKLPRDWNLLGEDYNLPDIPPRETLFHLAARLGLQQVTEFLMYQPGSLDALSLQNSQSLLPLDIAKERGDEKLINTLLGKNCYTTGGPPWLEKWKKPQPPTMVQRHEYGMATITNDTTQSKRTLDDDIQLLHNMSKVVYDDNRGTGEEQPPPVPPHSSATRQRHSMAEDYYRQKLYYSDHYSAQQRHSLAEQHAAPRMYDIPMETPQGYAERKALPAPSHRHRPTPARPRLPSPDRTSSKSHSASSYDDSETPPPLPKRPSSDRLVDTTMPNLETQSQGMALDRGRERRPLLNMDTLTFEEHMSSLDTPPVLTPHNQQSRDPRSVDRLEKQKLRQSSNQIRDRLSSSDCKKSDWSDSENQEHNRDASRVAPPRARRTEERIPSPDDTKKARYTGYHEEQSISTPGYGRRRHRSGHEAPTQFASSEKAPDAQRIKWPPSVEDIHKKKSQSSSEYRPISLIRPRVYSLDNQVSPSKVSLPYQHARSSSMEDHQNQLLRSSNEEVLIEPPYECPIPCESPIQKTYCRPELQIRLAQAQRQKDYARKIQSVVSKSSVQRQSKPPKPPKPDPSLSRPHPTGLPPKPARSPVSHGRSASMEGMYMYRSESHEEERLMSSDGLAQRVRYKSEEPTRLKTLSDGQAPAPDDEPSEARSAREPYHVGNTEDEITDSGGQKQNSENQSDDFFQPILRPRLHSLENRPTRNRLSLPVEQMRAASMERVDRIGIEAFDEKSKVSPLAGIMRKSRDDGKGKAKASRTMSDQTQHLSVPAIKLHPPTENKPKRKLLRSDATVVYTPPKGDLGRMELERQSSLRSPKTTSGRSSPAGIPRRLSWGSSDFEVKLSPSAFHTPAPSNTGLGGDFFLFPDAAVTTQQARSHSNASGGAAAPQIVVSPPPKSPEIDRKRSPRQQSPARSSVPLMGVSSLASSRPLSLEFGAVSPAGRRSQSPAPSLGPVVRERVHSFDSRTGRSRLSLPPDTHRSASSEHLEITGAGSTINKTDDPQAAMATSSRLERAKKEADLAGLLATPPTRDRSRSRSPGPPKASLRRRELANPQQTMQEKKLIRAQTLPESSRSPPAVPLLPRPITIKTGNTSLDLSLDLDDKLSPRARPRPHSLGYFGQTELSLLAENMRALSMENVDWVGKETSSQLSPKLRSHLLFPDTTEARSSFHGLPSKSRKSSASPNESLEAPKPEKKSWSFRRSKKEKAGSQSILPRSSTWTETVKGGDRERLFDDEPVVLRQRVNSLESSPTKSNHRLSLPVAEMRSASFESISPTSKNLPREHWFSPAQDGEESTCNGVVKRAMSETIEAGKEEEPQRKKKISRFLSFFRKSKHSKVEFADAGDMRSGSFRLLDTTTTETIEEEFEPIARPRVFSLESRPNRYRLRDIQGQPDKPKTSSLDGIDLKRNKELPLDELQKKHFKSDENKLEKGCYLDQDPTPPASTSSKEGKVKKKTISLFRKSFGAIAAKEDIRGLGDSEGSEDESKSGRRYKRNTFGAKPGSHYRKIYQKHQAGSHSSGRSREGESASSGRMESTTSMGLSEPATPASSHYGDVFSPSTDPYNENVLEDSLRRLQEINDGIYKLREENSQGEQKSSRRNSLQRHSTSCPSLAEKLLTATKIVPIEDSEHHRSMQELIPDSLAGGSLTSRPAIIVDDVSHSVQGGETSMGGNGESEMLTIEQMKKQQRRSSWCPEEERKKEEKTEKQILLGVSGRSQSLSSLEGEADDSEPEADSDADCSYARQGGESYGEGEDLQYMDVQNSEDDDEDEDTASRGMRRRPEIRISGPDGDTKLQGSDSSPGVSPYTKAGQSEALVLPTNLAKASSTPSIISGEEETVEDKKRSGSIPTSNGSPAHLCGEGVVITTGRPRDGRREVVDDTDLPDTRLLSRRELLLSDPTTTIEDAEQRKDERKKKQSIFSKMGSYRQKKISKERPASASHQFVSISISNSTACDLCGKPMANKSCLQCENCMVNVHENSCKDQISYCMKARSHNRVSRIMSTNLPAQQGVKVPGANLKSSQSFKESSRSLSAGAATNKHSGQVSQSANSLGKAASSGLTNTVHPVMHSSPGMQLAGAHTGVGYFQWRRVATKLGIDKALSEEKEEQQGLVPESSNITETLSVSMESIEEAESNIAQITEVELERDLHISSNEPEAWSVTVDKKTLKKMTAKDIKRQDTIWEFIQTEKSHCRTLRIMQKIFYQGLLQECELSQEMVDRIFPRLYDLLDIHLTFLQRLLEKQRCHADKSISSIGDLFKEQFEGVLGDRMKQAYGEFCSRHKESVQLYKDILKSDKKLQIFAKKCSRNSLCKRLDIPACILLVTQRPTKYPLLLESLVKATKEYEERENLTRSLLGIREILAYIDKQIDEHEKYQKLIEIYNKVDARSSAVFNQKKFKKSDLLSNNRKLLHEGIIKFMNARGKTSDVLAVILSDVMFFLVENNQKYTFFSQDNKSSVIALSKLLVREKGDTKDSKGIYLICQSKTEPEMYELVCKSADERKYWIQTIKAAIGYCLEQEAGSAQNQEDKKLLEARTARLRQLIDNLAHVDQSIRNSLDNKNKLLVEMVDLFCKEDSADGKLRSVYKDEEGKDLQAAEIFLQTALLQGEKLMALLQTSAALSSNGQSTNLSRSVSSVGEHSTGTTTPPLPKRADTFSGFESKENHRASAKKRFPTTGGTSASEMRENNDARNNNSTATLEEADSGLGLDTKLAEKRRTSVAVPYLLQDANKQVLPKEKINRRMSTSFLQNLLNRQHLEKDDSEGSNRSDKSSDRGSALDLSNLSPAISISNLAVSREQCACLAQLMQSVHGLAAIASQQSTEVESFKAQLAEANAKISRLYSEPERYLASDKKNTYHHDKQLEELRNLQEQINQDRSVFEKEKSQQNLEIHQERQEIKAERENISKQKSELKAQRDELQRQREALQKQMDLFEQQKSQFNKTVAQVGDIVSSRTPPSQRERSESPASSGSSLERTHKRAGSTDLHSSREGSPFEPMAVGQSNSLKEPLNKAKPWSSSVVVAAGAANNSNAKNQLPMHLKSSSNDIKMGSVVQQLPLKLAGKTAAKGAATGTSGVKQVLPFKLSASVSPQAVTSSTVVPASKGAAVSSCASPPLGPRASQNSSGDTPKLTHTRSHPTLPTATVAKARTVSHHNSVSNVLPLKLAEAKSGQRPQSASSAGRTPQGSHHPDQKDSKSGKKEPEIIYF